MAGACHDKQPGAQRICGTDCTKSVTTCQDTFHYDARGGINLTRTNGSKIEVSPPYGPIVHLYP